MCVCVCVCVCVCLRMLCGCKFATVCVHKDMGEDVSVFVLLKMGIGANFASYVVGF